MRSRSNSLEDATKAPPPRTRRSAEREEPPGRAGGGRSRYREQPGGETGTVQRNHKTVRGATPPNAGVGGGAGGLGGVGGGAGGDRKEKGRELSRDDLLFLLSMLEGELQVRQAGEWASPVEGCALIGQIYRMMYRYVGLHDIGKKTFFNVWSFCDDIHTN